MDDDILYKLIKLYYENIEIFKNKCMSIDDLLTRYMQLYSKFVKNKEV